MNELTVQEELRSYELPEQQERNQGSQSIRIWSTELATIHFTASSGKDFQANLKPIETLVAQNKMNNPSLQK